MAYQVISQNNTTTTLADENGNIIRVPARVSLATSTDYTIKKVNNSTATLEDGNGNIIRDVPCVAVLFGGEGGGSDPHNLGWYATQSALTTAHPTAGNGDWAIVGSTDTVWVWDSDTTAWKDTGQAGIELPSQTGNSGKFLTTNGTAASWSDKPLVNKSTESTSLTIFSYNGSSYGYNTNIGYSSLGGYCCTAVGAEASAGNNFACAFGQGAKGQGQWSIALGYKAKATQSYGIQIGPGTNSTPNSLSVALSATSNYTLLSSDGTIPEARLADTTNAQQGDVLTLDANGDAVWQAGGSGGGLPSQTGNAGKFLTTDGTDASWSDITKVNTTITLAAADWSSNTQTVTVNGVTSTSVVLVAPDPADTTDYVSAGILCTAQGTNSLTFTATTTPSADIDVVVVAM